MKFERYYHQNAATRISSALLRDVETGLRSVSVSDGAIAPNAVTNPIRNELTRRGWSGEVFLSSESKITISGQRGDIGLALQFGNVSRIYADLLKLQSMFMDAKLRGAVVIVPAWSLLASLSKSGGTDNRCNLDRIKRELPIFSLVITMPIAFYGIDRD